MRAEVFEKNIDELIKISVELRNSKKELVKEVDLLEKRFDYLASELKKAKDELNMITVEQKKIIDDSTKLILEESKKSSLIKLEAETFLRQAKSAKAEAEEVLKRAKENEEKTAIANENVNKLKLEYQSKLDNFKSLANKL